MRLKVFTAPTIAQAMAQLRAEIGPDAVIVSTEQRRDEARVIVAMERPDDPAISARTAWSNPADELERLLAFHHVSVVLARRVLEGAQRAARGIDLRRGLEGVFRFANIGVSPMRKPILLCGPAGAGKTLTAAKLAARAVMGGIATRVATTDTRRAGGVEQLAAFTRLLGLALDVVETPSELRTAIERQGLDRQPALSIIDTAAANPLAPTDLGVIAELLAASKAEAVLVLAAGGDGDEAADTAAAFRTIGCARLIATRIDAVRRLGGVLAAADGGRLALAEVGTTPQVARGLTPLDGATLAGLLSRAATGAALRQENVA